jgi:hypothetical protein
MSDKLLPVTLRTTRSLLTLLDRKQLTPQLTGPETSVLFVLAASANPANNEVWMSHATISRRTSFRPTAIKDAIKRLIDRDLLVFLRHKERGVVVWRLCLPEVVGTGEPEEVVGEGSTPPTSEPFDVVAYVKGLDQAIDGVEPALVRAVVGFHTGSKGGGF